MKVTVIYGNCKNTSTYDCVQLLLNNLKSNININIDEFFLARDYFIDDCCISKKNHLNISSNIMDSIVKSINDSDLIILASSVFTCDISSEMKLFLTNLTHYCKTNNLNSLMYNKIGLIVSTASGAGLFYATRILKKNLNTIGIYNIFKFSKTLYGINLKNVNLKTKKAIYRKISKLSSKILNLYFHSETSKPLLFRRITSSKIHPVIRSNNYNVVDLNYCKKQAYSHIRNI